MKEKIKKNNTISTFSLWDSIVLFVLALILIPFALNILETFISQNYIGLFVNLGLFALTLWGIIKYTKKLLVSLKNPITKKGAIKKAIIILVAITLFSLRMSGIL